MKAVLVGTHAINSSGEVLSHVPENWGVLKPIEKLSAASFYLGDACLVILHLEKKVEDVAQYAHIKEKLYKSMLWLRRHSDALKSYDAHAPNRLLFDARSFYICGLLLNVKELIQERKSFSDLAIRNLSEDGYFIEGGGWDIFPNISLVT